MKIDLQAIVYDVKTKGDVRRLRRTGKIPGILYGHGEKSKRIYVLEKEFKKILDILKNEAITVNLKIENKNYPCLIKSVQHNPMTDQLLHIDFQHIQKKEKIKATVPIHSIGESPGVKKGGILDIHLHEVIVKCLPDDIPSHIDVDISHLDLGGTIHIKDIKIPSIEFEMSLETPVITVLTPRVEKEVPKPEVKEEVVAEEKKEEEAEVKEAKETKEIKEAPPKEKEKEKAK